MSRKPDKTTICSDCGRENVGVLRDWVRRNENNQITGPYRIARHKIKYAARDKTVPYCVNSRSVVPDGLVFDGG